MNYLELPEILELSDYAGNFNDYLEAVYEIFKEDFIDRKPIFRGVRLGLKKYPLVDNREYTFYHITHNGKIEDERIPDFRRMERIAWPSPMINESEHPYLKVWRNIRRGKGGTKNRILILHEEEQFLVVLDDRDNFILPWTAYYLEHAWQVKKKIKEYESFKKAEAEH